MVVAAEEHLRGEVHMYEAMPTLLLAHSSAFAAAHEAALHAQLALLLASQATESDAVLEADDDNARQHDEV